MNVSKFNTFNKLFVVFFALVAGVTVYVLAFTDFGKYTPPDEVLSKNEDLVNAINSGKKESYKNLFLTESKFDSLYDSELKDLGEQSCTDIEIYNTKIDSTISDYNKTAVYYQFDGKLNCGKTIYSIDVEYNVDYQILDLEISL